MVPMALPPHRQPPMSDAAITACIGLGANLGDARATLDHAAHEIGLLPGTRVAAKSSLYGSAPFEAEGPDYLNAVVLVQSELAPRPLLEALLEIERAHGRTRPFRNAPRTLDLDLLWHVGGPVDEPGLIVPHPRLHQRAFVLVPLAEVWPDLPLPGGSPKSLLPTVADQPIWKLTDPHWGPGAPL